MVAIILQSRPQRMLAVLMLALLIAIPVVASAVDALPFKDRAEEMRFQNLTRQLRCLQCQNESLADSQADLAKDLRHDIFEQMQAGKSDDQIKDWLTERYSDFVLYDPPLRGGTLLLWFGPLLVLLLGAWVLVTIVRRRSRASVVRSETITSVDEW
ncbi:MAG: cytochrome c-type biogenesis protein [Dokdonella sp.]